MKSIKSIISVILVFTMAFTFIACNEDEGENTTAEISTAPATAPESASDHITEELAETNTSIEDSADKPTGTNEPAEDTAEPEETEVPAEDTAAPETKAPAEDTAKAPTSTPAEDTTKAPVEDTTTTPSTSAPAEDTTKAPSTSAPVEDTTTAPVTTAPIEDPNVNYSEWGKHGFENLLPIPLPFSDEEADWNSIKYSDTAYRIRNEKVVRNESFRTIFINYVNEYESIGYTITNDYPMFYATSQEQETTFTFIYGNGYMAIDMYF